MARTFKKNTTFSDGELEAREGTVRRWRADYGGHYREAGETVEAAQNGHQIGGGGEEKLISENNAEVDLMKVKLSKQFEERVDDAD